MVAGRRARLSRSLRRIPRLGQAISGNVVYALCQATALAVITRSPDGARDAADFLLAQAVATPVAVLVSGRARDQFATEAEISPFGARLMRLMWLFALAFVGGTAGWLVFAEGQLRWVGIWVLAANLAQLLAGAYQGRAIRREQITRSSVVNGVLGMLSVVAMVAGYEFDGLILGCFLVAATWLGFGLVLLVLEVAADRRAGRAHGGSGSEWRDDLLIGLAGMAMMGQPSVARIGTSMAGEALAVAQFGTVTQLARLGSLTVSGIKAVLSPELAKAQERGRLDPFLRVLIRKVRFGILVLGFLGLVGGWLLGPAVIEAIFSASVRPTAATAAVVFGLTPLLYGAMLLNQVGIATNRSFDLLRVSLVGVVVTALLILPLAGRWGATGSGVALGVGYLARYLLLERALQPVTSHEKMGRPTRQAAAGSDRG